MTVAKYVEPNNTTQTASEYKAALDGGMAVHHRVAGPFAPHEAATPNMTVVLDAGALLNGTTLTEKAQQATGTITAPVTNPRIDRIVIDSTTGVVSVIAGAEAASPSAPALTSGKLPIAQVLLQTSTTTITNSMLTDERVVMAGLSGYAALAGSSSQDFSAQNLTVNGRQNLKTGANIASAATIDLSTATGNLVHITGTTATSAVTMTAGQWMRCIANNVWPLTYHATNNRISGGADYTCASNDVIDYFYDGTTVYGHITKANGTPVVPGAFTSTNGMQAYNTSQTLTTAHKGKYVYIYGTGAVTLTLPAANTFAAGESLLLANSQQSGAGTTTVSRAGTDVIFAKGSGALNTIGLGFGDSVWLVSNGVDQWIAVAEASHIGIGQTWQSVTRTHGTTYYNNTGKPIVLSAASITGNGTHIITVGGVQVAQSVDAAGNSVPISAVIPPNGTSYVVSGTGTETWVELR